MHLAPHMYKTITVNANAKEIVTLKMHLTPNMFKIVTVKANAKEIVTLKCVWTKYVQNCYFEGKC